MKENIQKQLRPVAPNERVAITITTKNRQTYLAALLTSLSQQTYMNWELVINDQSDVPINENDTVKDLLTLIESQGHGIHVIHTKNPCDRYQRVLEAVSAGIEFVHRIDDDVVISPTYLEKMLRPFAYFSDRPLARRGRGSSRAAYATAESGKSVSPARVVPENRQTDLATTRTCL